ncbi:MAG: hypothetical protein IJW06_06610 [Clostridia bacterium]|nr:hypothetical protein [Clostridia bacterium]
MLTKRKIVDFICAFAAFSIVLLSIAALTGESFFEGAVSWERESASLSLFGTRFAFDKRIPQSLYRLVSFNDVLFGKGAVEIIGSAINFFATYVSEGASVAFHVARMAVGAQ